MKSTKTNSPIPLAPKTNPKLLPNPHHFQLLQLFYFEVIFESLLPKINLSIKIFIKLYHFFHLYY